MNEYDNLILVDVNAEMTLHFSTYLLLISKLVCFIFNYKNSILKMVIKRLREW